MVIEFDVLCLMFYCVVVVFDVKDLMVVQYCVMVKWFVMDICFDVVNQVLQLYGGYGYLKDYLFECIVCDLCVYQIFEGMNEIM